MHTIFEVRAPRFCHPQFRFAMLTPIIFYLLFHLLLTQNKTSFHFSFAWRSSASISKRSAYLRASNQLSSDVVNTEDHTYTNKKAHTLCFDCMLTSIGRETAYDIITPFLSLTIPYSFNSVQWRHRATRWAHLIIASRVIVFKYPRVRMSNVGWHA